jgi:hypothetical protein
MKITKDMVNTQFERFLRNNNLHQANDYKDVGGYSLDFRRVYGGYVIECIANAQGAVSQPFGYERRSIKEMFDVLYFWNTVEHLRSSKQLRGAKP